MDMWRVGNLQDCSSLLNLLEISMRVSMHRLTLFSMTSFIFCMRLNRCSRHRNINESSLTSTFRLSLSFKSASSNDGVGTSNTTKQGSVRALKPIMMSVCGLRFSDESVNDADSYQRQWKHGFEWKAVGGVRSECHINIESPTFSLSWQMKRFLISARANLDSDKRK